MTDASPGSDAAATAARLEYCWASPEFLDRHPKRIPPSQRRQEQA